MGPAEMPDPALPKDKILAFGDLVAQLRPTQWVKNVVVFAGPAAGMRLFSLEPLLAATTTFVAFCLAASATYIINDIVDREADASHPTKRFRPIARGAIGPAPALVVSGVLLLISGSLTIAVLPPGVTVVLACYFLLTLAYSLTLKRRMILDVIAIATGFVLRAWAGSLAVGVATSEWLVACMFTLCLFLGFGKRRCEIAMIGNAENAGQHRRTLDRYSPQLLTHLITVCAGIAVMTFLIYTMDRTGSSVPFHKEQLFYTLPLVVYGVFRYAMLTELGVYSGPTDIVLKDRALLATVLSWAAAALLIVYQEPLLGPAGLAGLLPGDANVPHAGCR
ncbi:MAG: decaprenyl-phosphate phosphoribosyltransferase [Phycisphaerae bacterium]